MGAGLRKQYVVQVRDKGTENEDEWNCGRKQASHIPRLSLDFWPPPRSSPIAYDALCFLLGHNQLL
jgi:hypothetical protein